MSLQYISSQFSVPAVRGARVTTKELNPRAGTIIGARGTLLRVRIDGQDESVLLHPRRGVHYQEGKRDTGLCLQPANKDTDRPPVDACSLA